MSQNSNNFSPPSRPKKNNTNDDGGIEIFGEPTTEKVPVDPLLDVERSSTDMEEDENAKTYEDAVPPLIHIEKQVVVHTRVKCRPCNSRFCRYINDFMNKEYCIIEIVPKVHQ